MVRRLTLWGAGIMLAGFLVGPALAADFLGSPVIEQPYPRFDQPKSWDWGVSKPLPDDACVQPKYLSRIVERFNWVQAKTWSNDVRMMAIVGPREVNYKTMGAQTMVDKVYCQASADILYFATQQRRLHRLAYIVSEDAGAFGITSDVTFCVSGLDWTRFHLHEPSCRVLNPY